MLNWSFLSHWRFLLGWIFLFCFYFRSYGSEEHMEILYDSLIKSSLGREDVAKLEKESVANSHEIRQTFRNASKAYYSYKYRTSVELIVGIALTGFFSFFSNIRGLGEVIFYLLTHHEPILIRNCSWIITVHEIRILGKKNQHCEKKCFKIVAVSIF